MDQDSKILNLAKNINNVTRKLLRTYDRQSNKKHVKAIKEVIKKNKTSLRKNVTRKIKRLKNMLKSTKDVSPCLLAALAEQEKCILNEGHIDKGIVSVFDHICSGNSVQNVIQKWNPDPSTHYYLYEDDPEYEEKKRKREEGEGIGWYSTINGCGQSVENKLLETSTLKDKRNEEKEKKRRSKLTVEERQLEDQRLLEFKKKYEEQQNLSKLKNKYEAVESIVIGGKYKKRQRKKSKKRKTRRKRKTRGKKRKRRKMRKTKRSR